MNYRKFIQSLRDINEGIYLVVGVSILALMLSGCQYLADHPAEEAALEKAGMDAVEAFVEKSRNMHNALEMGEVIWRYSL